MAFFDLYNNQEKKEIVVISGNQDLPTTTNKKNNVEIVVADSNYISSVKDLGEISAVNTTSGNELIISNETVTELSEVCSNKREAFELVAYLKDRYEEYVSGNEEFITGSEIFVVEFTELFVSKLLTALIETFGYDLVIPALDSVDDDDLFLINNETLDDEIISDEKTIYLLKLIKNNLGYETNYNFDERLERHKYNNNGFASENDITTDRFYRGII